MNYVTNPTNTQQENQVTFEWSNPQRDKYGRPVIYLYAITPNHYRKTIAVLCTLPKCYAAEYGHRYLINVWAYDYVTPIYETFKDARVVHGNNRNELKALAEATAKAALVVSGMLGLGKAA